MLNVHNYSPFEHFDVKEEVVALIETQSHTAIQFETCKKPAHISNKMIKRIFLFPFIDCFEY